MDRKTAEQLQVGDRVRHQRGGTWIILDRMDRGGGPHFRLRSEETGQSEGLTHHQYLDAIGEEEVPSQPR